ncbi:hydroquinone glucosyltransferase-like protein [Carex littledalei]|uniref:Glycosyltransferase n=1 Tax=Carex littledalei TaxID=544730 RepID=A0A833QUV6_9POAL|nr:hydroquinone glucosyltransferase-like protein [Carex littledalei]
MEKETKVTELPHIVFLTSPGMGHLIPFAELATRLACHHGFSATFLTFTNFSSPRQSNFLATLHPNISTVYLPFIPLDDIPNNAHLVTILGTLFTRSVPHVRDALVSLKQRTRLAAFVPDLFGSNLLPVAKELSVPHYIFFSCNCMVLLFFFHFPSLHTTTTCEYRDLPEPFHLPGCLPLPGKDFIEPVMDRKSDTYSWTLQVMRGHTSAQGILVNSFETLEPGASKALQNEEEKHPPIYLVGPLIRSGLDEADELGCVEWLDQQPNCSVLFVSFGSGGTLSMKQTTELAFGLEASGHRFLWVVRCPNDSDKSATYFNVESPDDPQNYLPESFVNRNKNKGMVVPSWAPQVKVLSHKATGGFLSHCGWNSTLESVGHGVPLIAWPLYAEQRMNALMLVDGAGIAVRPVALEDGVVERGEVARIVCELMDGERGKVARCKVKELQEAGISALSPEGPSHLALTKVANQWKVAIN